MHGFSGKPASNTLLLLLLHLLQLLLRHGWQPVPVSPVIYHGTFFMQTARAYPFELSNQNKMEQVEWGKLHLHAYRCRTSMSVYGET